MLYRLNYVPPKIHTEALILNVIVYQDRALTELIKVDGVRKVEP